ncbi:MAG: DUF885 domain-containing protein [Candidatus Korobacteraceae bacterium]
MRRVALVLCFFYAVQVFAAPADIEARRTRLNALISELWEWNLQQDPVYASILGDKRYNDQLGSDSEKTTLEQQAKEKEFLKQFEGIDASGLPHQDVLNRELEIRSLKEDIEGTDLKLWQMPVNQMGGIHINAPQMVTVLSFQTVKDYDDYIARLRQLPRVFEENTANMRKGMANGLMPPKFLLEKVVDQTNGIATQSPDKTPFAQPFNSFPASFAEADKTRLKAAGVAAIKDDVLPAYSKFAAFVKEEYVPKGRSEVGVWSLPNGEAIYAFRVRRSTTTDKTPEQIHQIGLQQVAEIEKQQLEIATRLGFKDLKSFRETLKTNPKLYAQSREQILDLYRQYIAQMKPELPKLFGRLPKADLIVIPVELFREKDASGAQYVPGTPDGSRPGHVEVNTSDPEKRMVIDFESTAYHEGVPGHHLQLTIAQEMQGLPPFRQHGFYGAYIEGWALYSERLGKEVGFYKDPYSDYGRLEDEMLCAIRLVVDTGMHYKHWTREQVVQYFHDHSAIDEPNVQSETNRYISWPAQALSYKMGQLKILELRARAQQQLGSQFDIREFHDQVIDSGALPLDVLDEQINLWIAQKKAVASAH